MTSLVDNYEKKTKQLINDLMYVKDNGERVYENKDLKKNYDDVQYLERSAIDSYKVQKNQVDINKLAYLGNVLNADLSLGDSDIDFIDKSIEKYQLEFNKNIEKVNYLDKEIMTKDKLIIINEGESNKKERTVNLLQKFVLFLFLMLIPVILMNFKILPKWFGFTIIIISFIVTLIVGLVQYYRSDDIDLIRKVKQTSKEYALGALADIVPKNYIPKCPSKCKPKEKVSEEEMIKPHYSVNSGNEVWLDNSENRWEDGDVPVLGATPLGNKLLGEEMEPQPYYRGATRNQQYVCRWNGDPKKMNGLNKGLEFTTTIPCEYFPGYETVKKV